MDELIDEIVSEYAETVASSSSSFSSAQQTRKDGQPKSNIDLPPPRLASQCCPCELPFVFLTFPTASQSHRMPELSPFTVSSPASLCQSLEGTAYCTMTSSKSDPERQLPLAIQSTTAAAIVLYEHHPPALRLAVAALPQAVLELCWLGYVWVASSLAFLLSWLF